MSKTLCPFVVRIITLASSHTKKGKGINLYLYLESIYFLFYLESIFFMIWKIQQTRSWSRQLVSIKNHNILRLFGDQLLGIFTKKTLGAKLCRSDFQQERASKGELQISPYWKFYRAYIQNNSMRVQLDLSVDFTKIWQDFMYIQISCKCQSWCIFLKVTLDHWLCFLFSYSETLNLCSVICTREMTSSKSISSWCGNICFISTSLN